MNPLRTALLGLAIAASTAAYLPVASVQAQELTACPVSGPTMPPLNVILSMPFQPAIVTAETVAPSDETTSIVITPDVADQIQCGRVAIETTTHVLYSTPGQELRMDIQVPAGEGPKPLVVYVPGGGFVLAMKENALDQRTFVAEAGFVVASVQYRTAMDCATFRDGIADVKSAIRYLRAHAEEYGIDPERVAVWGESAGGYLVSMVGVTNGDAEFDVGDNLDQSSDVQAVVDKFGTTDLSLIGSDFDAKTKASYEEPATMIAKYINGRDTTESVVTDPTGATTANPVTYVDGNEPPFLIFHGNDDRIISPSQTLLLHQALQAAGETTTRYVLDGANHGDMAFMGDAAAGLPWSTNEVLDIIVDFLGTM